MQSGLVIWTPADPHLPRSTSVTLTYCGYIHYGDRVYGRLCGYSGDCVDTIGVITELGIKVLELSRSTSPTILEMDSESKIDITQNPVYQKRLKHIRIR